MPALEPSHSPPLSPSLDIASLRDGYRSGSFSPADVLRLVLSRIEAQNVPGIWISLREREDLLRDAEALERKQKQGAPLPLYGVPFAVKDNIDVAGIPTTAACPQFSYLPGATSPAVARLIEAGAIVIGKTNLDQFATGLVGVRSPFGVPPNPFDGRYITGGSSSGSAAAVTRGQVSFALGTDTAGSGRVPAAFNNLVGLKPSRGLVSTSGVVPACRSLDCISVFALTCDDARDVAESATSYDAADAYSRPEAAHFGWQASPWGEGFAFGVPARDRLEFLGDSEAARLFEEARARLEQMGGHAREIDFRPFEQAASLLYEGPWVAERLSGVEGFLKEHPDAVLDVLRRVLGRAAGVAGTDVFRGLHQLEALRQKVRPVWQAVQMLLVPTTPTIYRIDEIAADPILLNSRLGQYVNFVNLLDLAGVAVPNGFRGDGLPSGVTFVGPWGHDAALLALAKEYHRRLGTTMGATGIAVPQSEEGKRAVGGQAGAALDVSVAVVGAHLSGEPLNGQLVELGARLVRTCRTSANYRLYALAGTTPPKPGLVRTGDGGPIEVEVWQLARASFGAFFSRVLAPLCMGTIELEDGEKVAGFLCESHATRGAKDITAFGGWRAYRRSLTS